MDVGVVPQLQFIDRVFLPRCEERHVLTVFRCSQSWEIQRQDRRCASGHAVEVLYESCGSAVRTVFLYVISTSSFNLSATCALRQSMEVF